jgi:tRNA pseudouridine13 synthase
MAEEGLDLQEMKIKAFREPFFSRGDRPALCLPVVLRSESLADELNAGRQKLVLRFDLPRGSYATLLVKRLQMASEA